MAHIRHGLGFGGRRHELCCGPPPPRDAPQGQRRKRAKPAPAAPLYRTRDAETAPSVFAQPGGSMFSPTFAQGMMLAELNASRAREQSERESQARFLGFMGVPK